MEELLRFLDIYEVWIYFVLGAVIFVYLWKVVQAWQEWRLATFGLERETALRRLSAAMTMVILLVLLGATEFLLVSFVFPSMPETSQLSTPTLDLLATPTSTLPASALETANPEMVDMGQLPTAEAVATSGCVPGQIEWTYPQAGDEISGTVELKGTVSNLPNLGFYQYEYQSVGSETWMPIAVGNQAVTDGALGGLWDTSDLTPGDYFLRLVVVVVVNGQNETLPACEIPFQITSP
jgi:hypothetical protein